MQKLNVVILAAGKGTRMRSALPKVLHRLAGKTLLQHTIDTARQLVAASIQVVIGHGAEQIKADMAKQDLGFVLQEEQLGTGHAVQQVVPHLDNSAIALVLYGDVPLLRYETLQNLLTLVDENTMSVLTCVVDDPAGLGRILRDDSGRITAIVEQKDASPEQCLLQEINSGIMAIPVNKLVSWLPQLQANNAQGEYYLTDLVTLALASGSVVETLCCDDVIEIQGINTRKQLAELERAYQRRQANFLMDAGITLRDPLRFDLRGKLNHGVDIEIDTNVILEGEVTLADGVVIGPNCTIRNSRIGAGSVVEANSVIDDAVIGSACQVGPFARIRPGTTLGNNTKVGNFVEIKKSVIGPGSKVSHLSYIGDATLGAGVNVGAGTITCNYDGVNKFSTIIGDNVFVGSNTALVAPVNIQDGATIGAGSVVTKDVSSNQLAIGRAKQTNISGWQRPVKKPRKDQQD